MFYIIDYLELLIKLNKLIYSHYFNCLKFRRVKLSVICLKDRTNLIYLISIKDNKKLSHAITNHLKFTFLNFNFVLNDKKQNCMYYDTTGFSANYV